jgi:hypothetical protein
LVGWWSFAVKEFWALWFIVTVAMVIILRGSNYNVHLLISCHTKQPTCIYFFELFQTFPAFLAHNFSSYLLNCISPCLLNCILASSYIPSILPIYPQFKAYKSGKMAKIL